MSDQPEDEATSSEETPAKADEARKSSKGERLLEGCCSCFFRVCFLVAVVAPFVGGLGAVVWQHLDLRRYQQPVPARVVSSSVISLESTDSEGTTTTYLPQISYEYVVGGREYSSSRVFAWEEGGRARWAHRFVDQYRAGQSTTAYCDPVNPSDAILTRRLCQVPYFFVIFPMPLLAIGIWVIQWEGMLTGTGAARLAAGLWHGSGILVWGHYFLFAPPPWEWLPLILATAYEWLGVMPLGLSLPQSGFAGRMRSTLFVVPIISVVGAVLGTFGVLLLRIITWLFMKDPIGEYCWVGYGAAAGAVVFGIIVVIVWPMGQSNDAKEAT